MPIAVAKAFSPGHVTGIFEVSHAKDDKPLFSGSRGAGFSIQAGITTTVQVYDSPRQGHRIYLNGGRTESADVSEWVVEKYARLTSKPSFVKVEHEVGIPIGYGLGSSGAAALSLSYALNGALGTGLSKVQAAQIAHEADIACKTGLGTVAAEYAGGFEVRTLPGAPGVGRVTNVDLPDYVAVLLCMAPISTKAFLSKRSSEINGLGGKMVERLGRETTVQEFLKLSFEFAEKIGMTEGRCKGPLRSLRDAGFGASVALFGETVFTIVQRDDLEKARHALQDFPGTLIPCSIDPSGARVL